MDYELEFHPVGEASRAGDAISLRYWDGTVYRVIVIDGGTDAAGANLVDHISYYYGADTFIDHVVCTHPDTDHACGLRQVLRSFDVGCLWIHRLWAHAGEILPYFSDARWTADGLSTKIRLQYPVIQELIELAEAQGAPVYEPFQGAQIGPLTVLSPTRWSYLRLVPQFRKTPDPNTEALELEQMLLGASRARGGIVGAIAEIFQKWVPETWDIELLREGAVTAAENESSVVLYGGFDGGPFLLTADAGVNALRWSCDFADGLGIDLSSLHVVQVPHHGSRSNVTPSILDRLIGPRMPFGVSSGIEAVVSCPPDDAAHPRKMVINSFRRRGAAIYKTKGGVLRFHRGLMPERQGWMASEPYQWFGQVEQYD